ncbi:unnamed protein product [Euphydryas editha]|uniref:Lipase domain-containing protein n=1 Tax=Euphydryas editha TaxID=104508 RepID=A0AAU9UUF2_EUPED|nr:unnamed protein product [Euphydryas editha]
MKLFGFLIATTFLCAGNAIPLVPRDNSHYVEGKSRYIWMPDADGNPFLVDLQAPVNEKIILARNGTRNRYWLFTRQNRNSPQVLLNGNANSINNSNYIGNRPTKVITHGFNSNGNCVWISQIKDAFLNQTDVNVIVLDWSSDAAGPLYSSVVRAVPKVGNELAKFLNFVFNTAGGSWNNVHLVGHSLGAHVVGNTGRAVNARAVRVTGLDPAGPAFRNDSNALNRNSGVYVEAIHTNGGQLGINRAICHADFYPNGGTSQPGCDDFICSHGRAPLLFASSITSNHLVGRLCTDLREANRNQCTGATFVLGNANLGKRGQGIYALSTRNAWPF